MSAPIVLATSLAPRITRHVGSGQEIGALYQQLCLQSWRESGFEVLSVNAAGEVDEIRAAYPGVEVVTARADMRALCGKPLIPVSEMMHALRGTGARVGGIVNADVFAAAPGLADRLRLDEGAALIVASRTEVAHPFDREGRVYRYGFDAFFFEIARASGFDWDPFTIGLPWWDYAIPTAFLLAGLGCVRAVDFPMGHLSHAPNWNVANWTRFHEVFRTRFRAGYAALAGTSGAADPGIADLPALRALEALDGLADRYAAREARAGRPDDEAGPTHRYRMAYSAAVVDLIEEMAGTRAGWTGTDEGGAVPRPEGGA